MERKPYLINKYLKYYLVASVLTMTISNINSVIDGVLMGQFLGPDALAAINVAYPVHSSVLAVSELLCGGAALLSAKAIGRMDYLKIKQIYTVSILSVVAAGLLCVIMAFSLSDTIAAFLCVDPTFLGLTEEYIFVSLCAGILTIADSGLGLLVDVTGKPRLVTKAMFLCVAVNVVCDILYVYVLGGGIGCAALATATGFLFSCIYLLVHINSKDCPYALTFKGLDFKKLFKDNIESGIPSMVMQVAIALLVMVINYYVQSAQGADGMFVTSIGVMSITVSFTIISGIIMAFMSIGGMLMGENDLKGLRMLFNYSSKLVVGSVLFFVVLMGLFSGSAAGLFGADRPELYDLAEKGLPFMGLFIPGLALSMVMGTVYQVLGFYDISQIANISSIVSVFVCMFGVSCILSPDDIWYAFPLASLLIVILVVSVSEFKRRTSRKRCEVLTLLPVLENTSDTLDISIPYTKEGLYEGLKSMEAFLSARGGDNTIALKANLCMEELILNTIHHAGDMKGHYMDLKITINKDVIVASLREDGVPFDPVNYSESKYGIGLKLIHSNCDDMNYRYVFGQNVTFLKWPLV